MSDKVIMQILFATSIFVGSPLKAVIPLDPTSAISAKQPSLAEYWENAAIKELIIIGSKNFSAFAVAFSPDGIRLAAPGISNYAFALYDIKSGSVTKLSGGFHAYGIAFSPDGLTVSAVSPSQDMGVWNAQSGERIAFFDGDETDVITSVISSDGKIAAFGALDGTIRLFDVRTGKSLSNLNQQAQDISSLTFAYDSATIASGSTAGVIRLWDIKSGKKKIELAMQRNKISALAFSRDGTLLVCAIDKGIITLIDVLSQKVTQLFSGISAVSSLAISPDNTVIAAGFLDRSIRLWNSRIGDKAIKTFKLSGGVFAIPYSLAFSPDGKSLAIGTWESILIESGVFEAIKSGEKKISLEPDSEVLVNNANVPIEEMKIIESGNIVRNGKPRSPSAIRSEQSLWDIPVRLANAPYIFAIKVDGKDYKWKIQSFGEGSGSELALIQKTTPQGKIIELKQIDEMPTGWANIIPPEK